MHSSRVARCPSSYRIYRTLSASPVTGDLRDSHSDIVVPTRIWECPHAVLLLAVPLKPTDLPLARQNSLGPRGCRSGPRGSRGRKTPDWEVPDRRNSLGTVKSPGRPEASPDHSQGVGTPTRVIFAAGGADGAPAFPEPVVPLDHEEARAVLVGVVRPARAGAVGR
ncbi:hypothetical protein THAOC_06439, partial [Thalassiosira oceanica]